MMSAKTVSSDTPAATPAAAPNNASAPSGGSSGPTDFQNLLAGAAPVTPGAPAMAGAVPAQPIQALAQLLAAKNQQQLARPASAAPKAPVAEASPGDMLKILSDSATLLPAAAEAEVPAANDNTDPAVDTKDSPDNEDALLSDWLDVMLPPNVFAPQAGSSSSTEGGDQDPASPAPIPTSLTQQAGLPDRNPTMDGSASSPNPLLAGMVATREGAPGAQNPVAALAAAAAAAATSDLSDKGDKPSNENWMAALGDLAARRAPDAAPVAGLRLSTPVHDPRWADALAHRLVVMARDGESSASLKLAPQDLGPLDIQITVRDGDASVHFGASHPETRAVLEASLPRLRELLSAQGLQLSNASVSHQSSGGNRQERSSGVGAVGAVSDDPETVAAQVISTSLLDIYA